MIPQELRNRPQWALWGVDPDNPKRPHMPYPRIPASVTDESTWADWDSVAAAIEAGKAKGAGYMLNGDYIVLDLDSVIDRRGNIAWDVVRILNALGDTYTEVSQSGRGLHIVMRGNLDGVRLRNRAHLPMSRVDLQRFARPGHMPGIELYDRARFIALTGDVVDKRRAEIKPLDAGKLLEAVGELLAPDTPCPETYRNDPRNVPNAELDRLLGAMLKGRNGVKIARLWHGDTSGYRSQSEADAALVRYLCFYLDLDAAAVDSMFRRSGLMRPKWDEARGGVTYGALTINSVVGSWHGDTLTTWRAKRH